MRKSGTSEGTRLEINSLSAIEHLLEHCPGRIRTLFIANTASGARVQNILKRAKSAGLSVDTSPRSHQGAEPVKALLNPYEYSDFAEWMTGQKDISKSLVLALDHLQDPQNFGALCRTAEGLGVRGVLTPKDRAVSVGAGVYHASVGAVETIPVILVGNLGEALRKLKDQGFWIVGSALGKSAKSVDEMPKFEKVVLVLGTELEGLSPQIEKLCDWQIEIPLKGKVQSLNVSAAGAILMYEISRRINEDLPAHRESPIF
jgi:23S rRNA (guanosine2251-2'-O)-methyltransferase